MQEIYFLLLLLNFGIQDIQSIININRKKLILEIERKREEEEAILIRQIDARLENKKQN